MLTHISKNESQRSTRMTIRFRKEVRFAELLTPLRNYEPEKQVVEHRYDPLTERTTVVTAGRFQYVKRNFESDEQIVSSIAESTKAVCPFCPSQLERSTPRFPSHIVPEGNIVVNDVVLFLDCLPTWTSMRWLS